MNRSRMFLLLCALAACTAPVEVPAAGYVEVELPAVDAGTEIGRIVVAGVPVARFSVGSDGAVTALVQGSPNVGRGDVVYTLADGSTVEHRRAVEVVGSDDPLLQRVVAVGASLTMGVQGGTPVANGQLHAPSLQVAQAVGRSTACAPG